MNDTPSTDAVAGLVDALRDDPDCPWPDADERTAIALIRLKRAVTSGLLTEWPVHP